MVCKEDVLLWFKDLEGYKRIEFMYELINMCVSFEVRLLGSCIEEIGKHSYQELRGPAITANDIDKLSKDGTFSNGLLDETTRHRAVIYLSLLSSRNCKCAEWFYKKLLRTESIESYIVNNNCKDENLLSELLLLYTIAFYHPAFTFEQKTFFGNMLTYLMEQKERKRRISPKPFGGYPPGFGYPMTPKISIPVKTASPMCHGDSTNIHHHPPCLPAQPTLGTPLEFVQMWTRPAPFPGTISGAPDVAPFPPQPISPIISQPSSPTASRAASPHRTAFPPIRSTTVLQPLPPITLQSQPPSIEIMPQLPLDPLSHTSVMGSFSNDLKNADDELSHIQDDKPRDNNSWLASMVVPVDIKPPNGIRFPPYKVPPPSSQQYFFEQMQALNLDGESSLHRSNSSSSTSSLNQSPPDTPTITPTTTPHGPGRGAIAPTSSSDGKVRVNGLPSAPPPPLPYAPLCDTSCPPPPPPVPYTNYPPHRTVFQYTQSFRPPFSCPYTYQPAENVIYSSYSGAPYVPIMISGGAAAPPLPPRNSNCYNCGACGHIGAECPAQTIEEITQKKAYTLEFNASLPDTDNK
ncbi:leucine-rich repeat extensin-like protein 5 isoform X2 [Agrilus planipennis]|uniref:Leucine-rich repeat extensin-like protein 5 isoform X2 n=1 Tax=Agrilus planipennis TaxID=224129 RepID=A0A1W4XBV8_AGRPL|nr:leucine-rich repeat extensin-like protein 5 isoform X2 [Agrilus planipennis]